MHDAVRRAREAESRDLWQFVPLECLFCAAAILLAAGLELSGLMP